MQDKARKVALVSLRVSFGATAYAPSIGLLLHCYGGALQERIAEPAGRVMTPSGRATRRLSTFFGCEPRNDRCTLSGRVGLQRTCHGVISSKNDRGALYCAESAVRRRPSNLHRLVPAKGVGNLRVPRVAHVHRLERVRPGLLPADSIETPRERSSI